jgi:2-polyprenyl-3-methyl-5-hydroxy-6-metoxy-1,4-benzoquinol methylase
MKTKRINSSVESPKEFDQITSSRYRFIKDLVQNKDILDIGCGYGHGSKYLVDNGARSAIGLDYSKNAIAIAKHNSSNKLKFTCLDAFESIHLNKKFDVIIAFELLEHLSAIRQEEFIKILSKLLTPNGSIAISTPNRDVFSNGSSKSRFPFHTKELNAGELVHIISRYFKDRCIYGLQYTNKDKIQKTQKITNAWYYRPVKLLESFKITHYLLPYIPKKIKTIINPFPQLTNGDFAWTQKNIKQTEDFLVIASK